MLMNKLKYLSPDCQEFSAELYTLLCTSDYEGNIESLGEVDFEM